MGQIWRGGAPPIDAKERRHRCQGAPPSMPRSAAIDAEERRHQEGALWRVGWWQVMLAGLLNRLFALSALVGCDAEFERSTW